MKGLLDASEEGELIIDQGNWECLQIHLRMSTEDNCCIQMHETSFHPLLSLLLFPSTSTTTSADHFFERLHHLRWACPQIVLAPP